MELVYFKESNISFLSKFWEDVFNFVDCRQYNKLNRYNNKKHVFIVQLAHLLENSNLCNVVEKIADSGFKVIIDNSWERLTDEKILNWFLTSNVLIITCVNAIINFAGINVLEVNRFFWFNEHLVCVKQNLNNSYTPNRMNTFNSRFLMPIGRLRWHRRYTLQRLIKYDPIYSNVSENKLLPLTKTKNNIISIIENFEDRNFNSDWYDQTWFSVVVETNSTVSNYDLDNLDDHAMSEVIKFNEMQLNNFNTPFITEKTYKPLAFGHPFVVVGQVNTLKVLQDNNFVTFDNVFNESYDTELSFFKRLRIIENNIKNFRASYDFTSVNERCKHNMNHFYNSTLVNKFINIDLVIPLKEFIYE